MTDLNINFLSNKTFNPIYLYLKNDIAQNPHDLPQSLTQMAWADL